MSVNPCVICGKPCNDHDEKESDYCIKALGRLINNDLNKMMTLARSNGII